LVASLPRPGGNVTRLSIQSTDLAGKRLELLRQVVPGLHRLAAIASVGSPAAMLGMDEVHAAGLLARPAPPRTAREGVVARLAVWRRYELNG
jgi:hypothetical protein